MIGFYAHHHGTGHLSRCRTIAAAVDDDTAVLGSLPQADVVLPLDAPAPGVRGADLDAHGAFHWAPRGHAGLAERMGVIAEWVVRHRPRAFHVDVSVEVAVLVRAMGVPVTVQAMPGVRPDAPHSLGYQVADAIVAGWPDWVPLPPHLRPVAERVHPVGGISRFAADAPSGDGADVCGRALPGPVGRPGGGSGVVIVQGGGGSDQTEDYWDRVAAELAAGSASGAGCRIIGPGRWVADPLTLLADAEVVVSAAGQNSVAELAVLGARAVVVAQTRPFAEQQQTAEVLRSARLAVVPQGVPEVDEWPGLIAQARALDPRWERWQVSGAARRAAQVLDQVAR